MKMKRKVRQFMAMFLCILMVTKIVMPALATVVATDSNARTNVEHVVLNTGENSETAESTEKNGNGTSGNISAATPSDASKASSSNAICEICGKETCECVICGTCGKKNCTEHVPVDTPKVGDIIWIRSGSKVYKNLSSDDGWSLWGNYKVKIVEIIADDSETAKWYEFEFTTLGIGEIFLHNYKYVQIIDTSQGELDTVKPGEEHACTCGENAPENLALHADSCLRKQYVKTLITEESGHYKAAEAIYAAWNHYDDQLQTDILNMLKAYTETTYTELLKLINENKTTEEIIVDTMDSFVETVDEMPEAEDVKSFDEAETSFAEIHAMADRDSELPKDEADKYESAYRIFAEAMGYDDSVEITYPDTVLGEALKTEVYRALELLEEAEMLYDSLNSNSEIAIFSAEAPKDINSVLDLSEDYSKAKAKLDAILAVKPDLLENEAAVVDNSNHKVDSVAENIQMNLFNYGPLINTKQENQGFMRFTHSEGMWGWAVDSSGNAPAEDAGGWPRLRTILEESISFPYITQNNSNTDGVQAGTTQYLFDPNYTKGRVTYEVYNNNISSRGSGISTPYQYHSIYFPVNNNDGSGTGLFQKDGSYFVYDSAKNAAWYNPGNQKFEIYDYVLRPAYTEYGNAIRSGNFLPFNKGHEEGREDYQTETYKKEYEYNGKKYTSDNIAKYDTNATKPNGATTAYRLWGNDSSNEVDLWFGLNFEFDFYQPQNGKVDNEAMVFEFLGDDDVFVYIDDVLILDIGGTHAAQTGTINFATGAVKNPSGFGQYGSEGKVNSTIYDLMKAALGNKLDDSQFIDSDGDEKLDTFKDYTTHNLKFYYLERGGNISYCKLKFNMDPLPVGSVSLQKQVTGVNSALSDNQTYHFQVNAVDANGHAVNGMKYQLMPNDAGNNNVYTVDNGGTIALKAGQVATFTNLSAGTRITFQENVDSNITSVNQWSLNGVEQSGNSVSTVVSENGPTANFVCTNTRKTGNLIIEKILQGDSYTTEDLYTITVKIGGNLYTGSATKENGTVAFIDGSICLKAGEHIMITGIPSGMTYDVTETLPTLSDEAAYFYEEPQYENTQGTIQAGGNTIAKITNTLRFLYGELQISKSGIDSRDHYGADFGPNGEAQSTIYRIQGTSNSGVPLDMQVVIKGNSTAVIKNIPVGRYTVTELTDWSWRYSNTEYTKTVSVEGGKKAEAVFVNNREKHDWLSGDSYCENWWGRFKAAASSEY